MVKKEEIDRVQGDENAVGVRPTRIIHGGLRLYNGVLFGGNAELCTFLRRLRVAGVRDRLDGDEPFCFDIIDDSGDILYDVSVGRRAFEYARQKLNFTVDHGGIET